MIIRVLVGNVRQLHTVLSSPILSDTEPSNDDLD
jgi:hypothetical protein